MGALRCGPSGRSRTSSGPGTCPYLIRLGGVAHAPHHDPGRTPLGWSLVPGKRPFTPTWRVADNAATTAARTLGGNRGVVHATVRTFPPCAEAAARGAACGSARLRLRSSLRQRPRRLHLRLRLRRGGGFSRSSSSSPSPRPGGGGLFRRLFRYDEQTKIPSLVNALPAVLC